MEHEEQVLEYAITLLEVTVHSASELEMELAVSSTRANIVRVTKLLLRAARASSFSPVASEVMHVFTKPRLGTSRALTAAKG